MPSGQIIPFGYIGFALYEPTVVTKIVTTVHHNHLYCWDFGARMVTFCVHRIARQGIASNPRPKPACCAQLSGLTWVQMWFPCSCDVSFLFFGFFSDQNVLSLDSSSASPVKQHVLCQMISDFMNGPCGELHLSKACEKYGAHSRT